jgi:small-conductance mechanosensitive channel
VGAWVTALIVGTLLAAGAEAGSGASAPTAVTAASTSASPPPPAASSTVESELEQARGALARLQQLSDAGAPLPLLEEQRNLMNRLVLLLAAQQRGAGAGETGRDAAVAAEPAPLGAPPYSVGEVDALRDWQDSLLAQTQSLDVSARALETQVGALLAARRKAEEVARLRQDRLSRAREPDVQARLAAEVDVARLEARIAGIELARADGERAAARERIDALAVQIDRAGREVERARPHQRLDEDALAQVAASVGSARQMLVAQRRPLEARLHALERTASGAAGGNPAAMRELAALRSRLEVMTELEQIETGRDEVWRQRKLAMGAAGNAGDAAQARAVVGRSIEQLGLRAQATAERLALARTTLRAQRLRVDALTDAAAEEVAAERRALDAMQLFVDALETVQERLSRLQRLLQRSQDDLAAHASEPPLPDRFWSVLRHAITAVWQYELFSVSESTQVEGRAVTQDYGVTVGKSIGVLGLFVIGWLLSRRLTHALVGLLVRRLQLSPQVGKVLSRWLLSLLVVAVLILVLKLARIPLTAFAFLGGALAIGVGFGTQNIIKNLISGVIILFERKVRVGDVVTIDGVSGIVSSVDLRATTVRGFDGIEAIVPNSQLLENRVSNWSYGDPVVRRSVAVGLRYGHDARLAAAAVLGCANADPAVLRSPAPEVLFDDFGPDAQALRLLYWLRLGGPRSGPTVDSDLRHAISEAFATQGLVMAYPQRDVHLDVVGPLDVRLHGVNRPQAQQSAQPPDPDPGSVPVRE